ncbi:MAG: BCD family MFS transporter [Pseudomonadota bacterium]
MNRGLSWFGIVRLGLVQTALGAIVVLTTATLNRVMVVELALPAVLPAALVGLYYAVQLARPRWGFGSDVGGSRTPWIIGGMAVLAASGSLAAVATAWMATAPIPGLILSVIAFLFIGAGVGAAGTSLLALLATAVAPQRRAAAASITWMMMIAGFVVTTATAGALLDPFSYGRLVLVTSGVSLIAFLLATVAVAGIERRAAQMKKPTAPEEKPAFAVALREVWAEPKARRFTLFVFLSMLAYSMQDLILEPFAGLVFGMTPGESTKLASLQHSGVFAGMVLVALAGSRFAAARFGSRQDWVIGGCIGSALALLLLVAGGLVGQTWPLKASVFLLGLANGAFAVAAIGTMMGLASEGRESREGMRMGLWGAAQAIAFGVGGIAGAGALDVMRLLVSDTGTAFAAVFALEAGLFLVAALMARSLQRNDSAEPTPIDSNATRPLAPAE